MSLSRLAKTIIQGAQDAGETLASYPVSVAGAVSNGVIRSLRVTDDGRLETVGVSPSGGTQETQGDVAAGAAATGTNPFLIGISDGTNVQIVRQHQVADIASFVGVPAFGMCVRSSSGTVSVAAESQIADAVAGGNIVPSATHPFNGATYDRERNNTTLALLASAARTATTASSNQTNYNNRGVIVYLDVSVNPGGAETLTLQLQYRDETSGNFVTVATSGAIAVFGSAGGATGTEVIALYPGAAETAALAGFTTQALPLSRSWRINVVHSAGGSWTYSARGNEIL